MPIATYQARPQPGPGLRFGLTPAQLEADCAQRRRRKARADIERAERSLTRPRAPRPPTPGEQFDADQRLKGILRPRARRELTRAVESLAADQAADRAADAAGPTFTATRRLAATEPVWLASWHEAGHAVVGHVLGRTVEAAAIRQVGGGQVLFEPCPVDPDREAVVNVAGAVAVAHGMTRPLPRCLSAGGDRQKLIDWTREREPGSRPIEDSKLFQWAAREAAKVLLAHWPTVRAVATALRERGQLSGADLQTMLRG